MSRWRIGAIGPTELYLHPAMLLYGLYAFLTGHGWFLCMATGSILLHETAHAVTAAACGEMPASIELTPLGAVMRLDDEARLSPMKRLLMLLAGPLATFLLCGCALYLTKQEVLSHPVGRMLFVSNLSILLLNLLPVLPLDGGRVLSLLLGLIWPLRTVGRVMRWIGSLLGMGLIALNLYAAWRSGGWNLSLAFAGCCMLYSSSVSTTTQAMAELRQFMERKIRLERKGSAAAVMIAALHTSPIRKLVRALPANRMAIFACLEAGSLRCMGCVTEADVIQQYLQTPEATLDKMVKMCRSREKMAEIDKK